MTGSIGVYTQHIDLSKAMEMDGVSQEFISAGKYKVEGNSYGPLSDEARAFTQSQIDAYYSAFTSAVAKGRGKPIASVRDGMGQGRCLLPADALSAGMIDGVDTFDGAIKSGGVQASVEDLEVAAAIEQATPAAKSIEQESAAKATDAAGERERFEAEALRKSRAAARERRLQLASL
jgi:ClpP class serine protease